MKSTKRSDEIMSRRYIFLAIIVVFSIWSAVEIINKNNQLSRLQSKYNTLIKLTTLQQRDCIQRAQDLYKSEVGLTDKAALNLSTSISSCQTAYPTLNIQGNN